jgi:hypothetical protein
MHQIYSKKIIKKNLKSTYLDNNRFEKVTNI